MDVAEIEKRVDRVIAGAVVVSNEIGGVKFASMVEVMEFAKLMAVSGAAVPAHLRANPGACLGIVVQALEWRMSPFAVANKSYIANDRTAYESQLIHAIVEARAPLRGRLRYKIVGEGDERRCEVSGLFRGETEPHVYLSETLAKLRDARGRNDRGTVKGSPLWEAQPEVQLFYSASRTWARMYCPDVILGIYAVDELPDNEPVDVTLNKVDDYVQKLRDARASRASVGFDADKLRTIVEGEVNSDDAKKEAANASAEGSDSKPVDQGERDDLAGRERGDRDATRRNRAGGVLASDGSQLAGHATEGESVQGDLLAPKAADKPKGKRK
jgi:hypothetical protein